MSSSDPASPILFHGPTAQGRSAAGAGEWGRVIGVFGDPVKGLDTDTIRQAVEAMSSCPVGDKRGSVIVGPVDVLSQDGVVDLLLKTLEEVSVRIPRPYLWAYDAGLVQPTIRSRCLIEWCPGSVILDRSAMEVAKTVVEAALAGSMLGVLEGFSEGFTDGKKGRAKDGEESRGLTWKDGGGDFLRSVALLVSRAQDEGHLRLWGQVRHLVLSREAPPMVEVLAGFLP